MLAFGLDIMNALRANLPASISSQLLTPNDMTRASYYLLASGLLTAIPAIVTGGAEAMKMIQKQGMYDDQGNVKTKVKATIAHAVANDIVVAASTYIWYQRRARAMDTLVGKIPGTEAGAYAPEAWMVVAQTVILALLGVASNIGGTLTYNFGVGFSSASKSDTPVVPGPKKVL